MAKRKKKQTVTKATLDRSFSLALRESYDYICAYPECPMCGNYSLRYGGGLDTAHYYRRYRLSGRWHPDNCAALCRKIHNYLDEHPPELVAFFKALLGDTRHEWLMERHHQTYRYPAGERYEMNQHYKAQIVKIDNLRMGGETGPIVLTPWD